VIIIAYASVTEKEARVLAPRVVHVDAGNRIRGIDHRLDR
jgi:aspartate 1-decarboxylase